MIMMTTQTAKRIVMTLLPEGAVIKNTTRGGKRAVVVIKDGNDVFVASSILDLALKMEEEARKLPMSFSHPDTHLFKRPATIVPNYAGARGDFFLVGEDGFTVSLHWVDYACRWVATFNGGRLVYGREFKMSFTEEERNYPAIKAWFTY